MMSDEKLSFSDAHKKVMSGMHIFREGWNGKGMEVFFVSQESIKNRAKELKTEVNVNGVTVGSYLVMKDAQDVLTPWTPSQQDMCSHDWRIVS
jgi:acyl CoA:acetate/3-ketoacid CoA transferase alpha subunit